MKKAQKPKTAKEFKSSTPGKDPPLLRPTRGRKTQLVPYLRLLFRDLTSTKGSTAHSFSDACTPPTDPPELSINRISQHKLDPPILNRISQIIQSSSITLNKELQTITFARTYLFLVASRNGLTDRFDEFLSPESGVFARSIYSFAPTF